MEIGGTAVPEAIKRQLSISEEVWGESTADPKTNLTKILDFHSSFFVYRNILRNKLIDLTVSVIILLFGSVNYTTQRSFQIV